MGMFDKLRRIFKGDQHAGDENVELRQGTAEFEFFVAQGELERGGNLEHGLSHLASLLSFDPGREEWLELVDRYREAAAPRTLLDLLGAQGDKGYFATEALRARLLAEDGDLEGAVSLFSQVAQAKGDVPYLEHWLLPCLEPEGAYESLSPSLALQLAAAVLNTLPESTELVARRRPRIERLARVVARLAPERLEDLAGMADMTVIGVHRKAGLFDEALELAQRAVAARPSWHTFTALGLVRRARDECDEAKEAFDRSRDYDPEDVTSLLETGDMFFNREEWTRARESYEQVLARQADHPWAVPSIAFCAWREKSSSQAPDDDFPAALLELARSGNSRADGILDRFRAYHGYLPASFEATANCLRQILDKGIAGDAKLTLSDVESPSNQLVWAALKARDGKLGALSIDCDIATPDPRMPVEDIARPVWKLENKRMVPALPAPPGEIAARIATLARRPYDPAQNWAAASELGSTLGASHIASLLACTVHPPSFTHDDTDPFVWVARVQLTAAQVIAHTETAWEGSARRAALMSLLLGPRDWVTSATILVLTRLVHDEPALFADVHGAFGRLDAARPDRGAMHYEGALFNAWPSLPQLFDNERDALLERLARFRKES